MRVRGGASDHRLDGEVEQLGGSEQPGQLRAVEAIELQHLEPAGAQPSGLVSLVDLGTLELGKDLLEQSGRGAASSRRRAACPGPGRRR